MPCPRVERFQERGVWSVLPVSGLRYGDHIRDPVDVSDGRLRNFPEKTSGTVVDRATGEGTAGRTDRQHSIADRITQAVKGTCPARGRNGGIPALLNSQGEPISDSFADLVQGAVPHMLVTARRPRTRRP